MPHIKVETIELLKKARADNAKSAPIIIPTVAGDDGHPVGFDHAYFAEIAELTGDAGAKPVIEEHQDKVIEVPVDDAGILQDVDVPEDL